LNRWEKDSSDIDIDNGVVHGVASKRILNIASLAMNKSEVEDTLRKVAEMLVTSKVTGKKRERHNIIQMINEHKSLHGDIKKQLIRIVPIKNAAMVLQMKMRQIPLTLMLIPLLSCGWLGYEKERAVVLSDGALHL
jgi:hypothetical protein